MGIIEYEQNRLRQQEIEVKALIALFRHGTGRISYKAMERLEQIAYPQEVSKKINRELSEYE